MVQNWIWSIYERKIFCIIFKDKGKVLIPIANFFKKIGYSLKIFFYKIIEFFNDLIFRDSGKKKNANRRSAAAKKFRRR